MRPGHRGTLVSLMAIATAWACGGGVAQHDTSDSGPGSDDTGSPTLDATTDANDGGSGTGCSALAACCAMTGRCG